MSTTLVDEEFRRRLRLIMQQFGSVADLARAVGVSDNAIYKWVSGRGQPSMMSLVNLSKAAGVSVEWLATGRGASAVAAGERPGGSSKPADCRLSELPGRLAPACAQPRFAQYRVGGGDWRFDVADGRRRRRGPDRCARDAFSPRRRLCAAHRQRPGGQAAAAPARRVGPDSQR